MKNKKGFTLVELLAVIAILAILIILALPNIMGMFNNAKKSSFITEAKRIFRGASENYVKDSFNSSGSKVYSKCKEGCNNELDMDVRDDLDYYIEINSSGKVEKYYLRDNSYQFIYEGEMTINDINDAEVLGNLDKSNIINISDEGFYFGKEPSCKNKLVTTRGSFSDELDVKEICFNLVNDGYVYQNQDTGWFQQYSDRYKYLAIIVPYGNLQENSFIRVYEDSTKNKLLTEITYNDKKLSRININDMNDYNSETKVVKILGEYLKENVYIEKSEGLNYSLSYTYENAASANKIYSGPWITDEYVINQINTLKRNLSKMNYYVTGISKCNIEEANCSRYTYQVDSVYKDSIKK